MPCKDMPPAELRLLLPAALAFILQLMPVAGMAAAPTAPEQPLTEEATVYTRALVRSVFTQDNGRRTYIRLKLIPRGKIPFSTLTFRVLDPSLILGLKEGASVAFVARRIDGETTLTAIRVVPPCERFHACQ